MHSLTLQIQHSRSTILPFARWPVATQWRNGPPNDEAWPPNAQAQPPDTKIGHQTSRSKAREFGKERERESVVMGTIATIKKEKNLIW